MISSLPLEEFKLVCEARLQNPWRCDTYSFTVHAIQPNYNGDMSFAVHVFEPWTCDTCSLTVIINIVRWLGLCITQAAHSCFVGNNGVC